jgi:hypothetical protein
VAGYSGTPLARKLGIAAGDRVAVIGAPPTYRASLEPLPQDVTFTKKVDAKSDLVHLFTTARAELAAALARYRATLAPDAVVWVSWPKKAARMPTDVTEDVIRAEALPLGFVDVKVCAVDEVWSGLKLVVRRELR